MGIHTGEIYGKKTSANKLALYNVLSISKNTITLQNIDNPLSLFEVATKKLAASGYVRISETPYIDLNKNKSKKQKSARKPTRCPLTLDFLEDRADSERPASVVPDLFTQPKV